jgi:hypothetical protein
MQESNPHLVLYLGIEPDFYIVLRESNPDCKTIYVGDGRIYGNLKKNFMETLYLVHETFFLFRESNPRNLFDGGKESLGRQ